MPAYNYTHTYTYVGIHIWVFERQNSLFPKELRLLGKTFKVSPIAFLWYREEREKSVLYHHIPHVGQPRTKCECVGCPVSVWNGGLSETWSSVKTTNKHGSCVHLERGDQKTLPQVLPVELSVGMWLESSSGCQRLTNPHHSRYPIPRQHPSCA